MCVRAHFNLIFMLALIAPMGCGGNSRLFARGKAVADPDGIMTRHAIAGVTRYGAKLEHTTHVPVRFLLRYATSGESDARYAVTAQQLWQQQTGEAAGGVLIVAVTDDRALEILRGAQVKQLFTPAQIDTIRQNLIPYMHISDYRGGAEEGMRELAAIIAAGEHVTIQLPSRVEPTLAPPPIFKLGTLVLGALLLFFLICARVPVLRSRRP